MKEGERKTKTEVGDVLASDMSKVGLNEEDVEDGFKWKCSTRITIYKTTDDNEYHTFINCT